MASYQLTADSGAVSGAAEAASGAAWASVSVVDTTECVVFACAMVVSPVAESVAGSPGLRLRAAAAGSEGMGSRVIVELSPGWEWVCFARATAEVVVVGSEAERGCCLCWWDTDCWWIICDCEKVCSRFGRLRSSSSRAFSAAR